MTNHSLLKSMWWIFSILFVFQSLAHAGGGQETSQNFLWIALLLLAAKLSSSLVEKWGQPAVLGELIIGVILGNLVLIGIDVFEPVKHDEIIKFLAELGVVILLFQIGLESDLSAMAKVGWRAFWVATVGVIVPFVLGTYVIGPWMMPHLSFSAYLFLGATLTATSVGITARVFRDLNKLHTPEAQIVLGAAVIDDVMGLIILAVVSAIVTTGTVSVVGIGWITLKSFLFLVGAIFLGRAFAPWIGRVFSQIQTGIAMKFTLTISFCLIFAYFAYLVELAPIVGAFAAGLMLDPIHFKGFSDPTINNDIREAIQGTDHKTQVQVKQVLDQHSDHHLEEIITPVGHFLVPLFFVITGSQVKLETLFDFNVLGIALAITVVAFLGKLVSGIVAGPVNKYIVGWGMAPRGEVGLIFAMMGKKLGVVSEEMFSVIVIVVILTTLLTPPILNHLLRNESLKLK